MSDPFHARANGVLYRSFPAIASGLLIFLATQALLGLIWAAQLGARLSALELQATNIVNTLLRFDEQGTRQLPLLRQTLERTNAQLDVGMKRLDALENRNHENLVVFTKESTVIRSSIDVLKSDMTRVQEQQTRIIQSLDSTYNLINEHLRTHAAEHK